LSKEVYQQVTVIIGRLTDVCQAFLPHFFKLVYFKSIHMAGWLRFYFSFF